MSEERNIHAENHHEASSVHETGETASMPSLKQGASDRRNKMVAFFCVGFLTLMLGAAYAAVPLYQMFCAVTGFGGTTQRADAGSDTILDRKITVRFDGNVNGKLPWTFKPAQRTVELNMGETRQVAYLATNNGYLPSTGTSIFNVTPFEAGSYFNKIECFCFTEQMLKSGETIEMPVVFFIDPDMDLDENLKNVKEITLSYTFFPVDAPEEPVAAAPSAGESKEKL